jgi:Flp pilus assembly protein CpaB
MNDSDRRASLGRWLVTASLIGTIALFAMQNAVGQEPPGRAMPLRVLQMDVASGLIKPDDTIDILAFLPDKATAFSMKDIRVLANEVQKGAKEPVVTVAVTAKQAEQLDAIHSAGHQFRLVLHKGKTHKAVAINITGNADVARFILPGTHVDLVVSPQKKNDKRQTAVLQDLRVLASTSVAPGPNLPEEKIATLEVTPEQAEQLIGAQALGDKLRLSLRGFPARPAEQDKKE